jgi:hypothetical protein
VSVASVEMAFSLAVSELDSLQLRSSGIHTERIWGQISPNDHDVARFHHLPARLLTPKQARMRSRVHLPVQRKRPTFDEECNVCYPYRGGKHQNDLISFPNGEAGATISPFFPKTNLVRECRTGRTRGASTIVMRKPTQNS